MLRRARGARGSSHVWQGGRPRRGRDEIPDWRCRAVRNDTKGAPRRARAPSAPRCVIPESPGREPARHCHSGRCLAAIRNLAGASAGSAGLQAAAARRNLPRSPPVRAPPRARVTARVRACWNTCPRELALLSASVTTSMRASYHSDARELGHLPADVRALARAVAGRGVRLRA